MVSEWLSHSTTEPGAKHRWRYAGEVLRTGRRGFATPLQGCTNALIAGLPCCQNLWFAPARTISWASPPVITATHCHDRAANSSPRFSERANLAVLHEPRQPSTAARGPVAVARHCFPVYL